MSHSPQVKFSFKNLQPINYLKTFNRMVDHQLKTSSPSGSPKKSQLKIVSLSKFPTPASYEHMQGIFQNISKKKVEQDYNKYSKELQQEQRFMKKHNDFMRKVLQKFIQHNQERQKNYQKMKGLYKKDLKGRHLRAASQSRLTKLRESPRDMKQKLRTAQPSRTDNHATIGSEVTLDEPREQKSNQILPKLKPRQKKQKVVIKKEKEIVNYIVNRKLTHSHPSPSPSNPQNLSIPQQQEQQVDFKQEIISLQKRQAKLQTDFSSRIQKQISQFGRKMSTQVHAINYFHFWKETAHDLGEQQRERKVKKAREMAQERQQRVDFQVNFRNYQST